jgi:superfamily II DNA or RNA helicase/HKD family nuclease/predicted house-cleaning noncanonical NTP pyrophosphatase (MazG superfamily)
VRRLPPTREKLIRDRIPALAAAQGRSLPLRTADPTEMARLLGLKLIEETHEVLGAIGTGRTPEVLDELADLQTVIDEIAAQHGLSRQDVERRAADKRAQRGGFDQRLLLREAPPASNRLHVGGSVTLLDALKREFEACAVARIAVAFVMNSGLDLIEGPALAALLRGAEVRLLTTDYLGVTEPEALERLCRWHGRLQARVFSHERRSFHPKAYLFERADGTGRAFIGSANLSRMGLVEGVEWTWTVLDVDAGQPMHELSTRFEEIFDGDAVRELTPAWIQDYVVRRYARGVVPFIEEPHPPYPVETAKPREVQQLALRELDRLRQDGESKALVVAATGLGKTFLAAFDARDADRVLFIAHREELLHQAEAAFERVYPARSRGFLADGRAELDRDVVFASVQTLSRPEHLARPELARFDHVVVDEFHHAAADSYRRVLRALSPRFLLGLTATPFRGDQRDILELCDGNLAYQVNLLEAIAFGWLVPFRYHGIADVVTYSDDLLTARKTYDTLKLTLRFNTTERAGLVLDRYRGHASAAALGFCVSIGHADFMAAQFNAGGVAAAAVHSGPGSADRVEAVRQLAEGRLKVLFTVDLFNEGVDIPAVDLVLFLRPTESMTIFLQQLGRGLRLHPAKSFLTVLDFIGNYRNAHHKLPLLAGQDLSQDQDPGRALKALTRWQAEGLRPDGVPEGCEVVLEPVALSALRASLQGSSPLRQMVLDDLRDIAEALGRGPTLREWQRQGRYSLSTARAALGVDRWHHLLEAAGLLTEEDRALEAAVGDFLREVETTAMTKSFKMVVLLSLCEEAAFKRSVSGAELVTAFRAYFTEERHREDVAGTEVEDVAAVDSAALLRYIEKNPINAWTGSGRAAVSPVFSWQKAAPALSYVGPQPTDPALTTPFARAIKDRALARLDAYWQRPGPTRMVFPVIPAGSASEGQASAADRRHCIMFGKARQGLPEGWHLVSINGRNLYGKFVAVALNVLKAAPVESQEVPNVLTEELRALFGGQLPGKPRVRFVRQTAAAVWEILAA